ncbi:MAG: hypothetical protein AB7O38_15345 [Pirellulaceae bacterium]
MIGMITIGLGVIATAVCGDGRRPVPSFTGSNYSYGYNPYQPHYGPIEAQRELSRLTHQPSIRGIDLGYGLGYFFGAGPSHHYHGLRTRLGR